VLTQSTEDPIQIEPDHVPDSDVGDQILFAPAIERLWTNVYGLRRLFTREQTRLDCRGHSTLKLSPSPLVKNGPELSVSALYPRPTPSGGLREATALVETPSVSGRRSVHLSGCNVPVV